MDSESGHKALFGLLALFIVGLIFVKIVPALMGGAIAGTAQSYFYNASNESSVMVSRCWINMPTGTPDVIVDCTVKAMGDITQLIMGIAPYVVLLVVFLVVLLKQLKKI